MTDYKRGIIDKFINIFYLINAVALPLLLLFFKNCHF